MLWRWDEPSLHIKYWKSDAFGMAGSRPQQQFSNMYVYSLLFFWSSPFEIISKHTHYVGWTPYARKKVEHDDRPMSSVCLDISTQSCNGSYFKKLCIDKFTRYLNFDLKRAFTTLIRFFFELLSVNTN